jgi:hypothetical protein
MFCSDFGSAVVSVVTFTQSNSQTLLNMRLLYLLLLSVLTMDFSQQCTAQSTPIFGLSKSWRYLEGVNLDGTNWTSPGYDDSAWPVGQGLLADESCTCLPEPIRTELITANNRPTFYFRTTFDFAGNPASTSLTFTNLIDDGAVIYLNGVEIQRIGMPSGVVSNAMFSSRNINNATAYDVFVTSGDLLTNLVVGQNVLAVEVHQLNANSSDVVWGASLTAASGGLADVTRGPYLQVGTPTSIVVRWRTDSATDSRVWFGTNATDLTMIADNVVVAIDHEVAVMNLSPDTKYFYAIGSTATNLAGGDTNHFFVTSPLPGTPKPTRVWVIADSGRGDTNQANVRDAYHDFTGARHTDLWLMLGDNAYDDGLDVEYQTNAFDMYPEMFRKSVLWSTLGNHETAQSTAFHDNYPYFAIFTFPTNGAAGGVASGTEHYYSFDYGNIHFICLDSMTASRATNGAMANWLRADLAATTNTWIVAFMHHPMYSQGAHPSDEEGESIQMRENILPILEANGVDLVLAGHSHNYERSYLLNGHYGGSGSLTPGMKLNAGSGREDAGGAYIKPIGNRVPNRGAVYVVAGTASKIEPGALNHPAMFHSVNHLGSLVLDIHSNRLDGTFIYDNGETNDYFTIIKQTNTPPVAGNLSVNVMGDSSANLALNANDADGNTLAFQAQSTPTHGLISNFNTNTGAFTYTPARGYRGNDGFAFRAHDGLTNSMPGIVTLTVLAPADTNANNLPDQWEGSFGISDSFADTDADGMANWKEYYAGTNPTNASSSLRIVSAGYGTSGHFSMTWAAVGGVRYRIGFSDGNVGENWTFTDIPMPLDVEMNASPAGTATTQSFTDDFTLTGGPPVNRTRYYRITVVQ